MTFDEFLVSKETIGEFDRDFVTKVKYKTKMQYILDTYRNAIYTLHQKDGNTKEGRT